MRRWDAYPEVLSPVGQPIGALLAEGPRRMPLDGFDPVYRDFVDYILRCTHRIWEGKNPGLCLSHYAPDVVMHTLGGEFRGAAGVVQGTISTLAAFADRKVIGEDVIWSEDAPGLFLSSHRITSQGTHVGHDAMLGHPTMMPSGARTVADCLCRENLIVEEWLVRDNARAVAQVGLSPWKVACRQAGEDLVGDPRRHDWRLDWIEGLRDGTGGPDIEPDTSHPAAVPARLLRTALVADNPGEAVAAALSPVVEVDWPTGRHGYGHGTWIGCVLQLRAILQDIVFRLDHAAARPLPGGDIAVALRWSLTGRHLGTGVWGPATGRDLLILAVSHYVLRGGAVVEDITVFDELAMLRQVAGGLGAAGLNAHLPPLADPEEPMP